MPLMSVISENASNDNYSSPFKNQYLLQLKALYASIYDGDIIESGDYLSDVDNIDDDDDDDDDDNLYWNHNLNDGSTYYAVYNEIRRSKNIPKDKTILT